MLKKKYYYPTDKYFTINVHPNYSGWGSTVPNGSSLYLKDSNLSLSATPASGYNFIKWNDENTNASRTVIVTEDKEYIAIFALPTYTVTYNSNGATSGSVPVDSDSPYSSGSLVEVLGNTGTLVKTGYTFDDWNTSSEGTGTSYSAGDTFNISDNTILYAQWDLDEYTLTYENIDADGDWTDEDYTVNDLPLTLMTPSSILGYGFVGWYLNDSYTGNAVTSIVLNPSSTGQVGPGDLTVYGKWIPRTYTLVFISGNNELLRFENVPYTCSDLSSLTSTGTTYTQVGDLPTVNYDGHWKTQNQNYDIIYTGGGTYMEWDVSDMEDFITASDPYEPNGIVYIRHQTRIIYNSNGADSGSTPSSSYDLVGNSVTVASNTGNLTKSGWTFDGWNTAADGSGTHYDPGDSYTLGLYSSNNLYAEWTRYTGTVTVKFPRGNSMIGSMYSGNPSSPEGIDFASCSNGEEYSMGLIINGSVYNPKAHRGPGGGSRYAVGSATTGDQCTYAIYEGTLSSACGVKLKGISISCIQNGALLSMQGTRTYTMSVGNTTPSVTCSYYDFTVPYENATIYICPIYESAS